MSRTYRTITTRFAIWATRAAMNRVPEGFRSNEVVRGLLRSVDFRVVLDSTKQICPSEFDLWHKRETIGLQSRTQLPIGWCAKMINVYLKTTSYVGDLGRAGLRECLHPPIDGGLWRAVECEPRLQSEVQARQDIACVDAISRIEDYDSDYMRIIRGCRRASEVLGCNLFEIEQLWGA